MKTKLLTIARAKQMNLKYYIHKWGEPEKEVTLDEYMKEAAKANEDLGLPPDHVPRIFMGNGTTGGIGGEDEGKLV